MKLVTFEHRGYSRIGCIVDNQIVDLHSAYEAKLEANGMIRAKQIAEAFIPANMVEFLQGGEQSIALAKEAVDFALGSADTPKQRLVYQQSEVKLDAPVKNPSKMICVGHNYREHILEMGRDLPPYPVIFAKYSNTIIGPEEEIPYYPISEQLDYEAEFIGNHYSRRLTN